MEDLDAEFHAPDWDGCLLVVFPLQFHQILPLVYCHLAQSARYSWVVLLVLRLPDLPVVGLGDCAAFRSPLLPRII